MSEKPVHKRRIQSFVRRDGRMTEGQRHAYEKYWPHYGLATDKIADFSALFQRDAPCVLEIGFGSGQSLLAMAKQYPEQNFIGVETYLPGIGALLHGMELQEVTNIRIFYADAVEILNQCIASESLDTIQIFFPDPWPKRRHHKRRLIQPEFVNLLMSRLKPKGTLHLATDWEHYAKHMMAVLTNANDLENLAGKECYANRSSQRPIVTKFEQRGQRSGRAIWELYFGMM